MRTSGAILGARRGPSRFRRMLRVGPAGAKSLSLLFVCLSLSLSLTRRNRGEHGDVDDEYVDFGGRSSRPGQQLCHTVVVVDDDVVEPAVNRRGWIVVWRPICWSRKMVFWNSECEHVLVI